MTTSKNKLSFIFIILSLLLIVCTGCGTTEIPKNQTKIPFLLFCKPNNQEMMVTKLSYWDLYTSNIQVSDKIVYSVKSTTDDAIPVVWDGLENFVLPKDVIPEEEFLKTSTTYTYTTEKQVIWGNNVKLVFTRDTDGKAIYDFEYKIEGKITTKNIQFNKKGIQDGKEVNLTDTNMVHAIAFNNKEIKVIFSTLDEKKGIIMLVANYNVDNDKLRWDEILLGKSDECRLGPGLEPAPLNSVIIGEKYYIKVDDGIAEIDLKLKKFKILDELYKKCNSIFENKPEKDFPREDYILGDYNGVLLYYVPVNTKGGEKESEICAIEDGRFVGAMHFVDDHFVVYNANKEKINDVNLESYQINDNVKYSFPKYFNGFN